MSNKPPSKLLPELLASASAMGVLRRDLHAHPELSYEEHRTSDLVASKLAQWNIPAVRGIAGTGLVGTLRHGSSKRSIGLRADMDALPIQEANRFAHASQHPGKMHGCGHDGHTAMLLAAAEHLAQHRHFDGTVHFIFQPAEEKGAGAQRMIQEGLFERFPCDAVFGLHNWPGMPVGNFGVKPGPMMAGTSGFEITVLGKSAHAAMPHLGVDALMAACHMAQGFQLLVSRERNPQDSAVLTITQIHAGETMNVVAEHAVLRGTVRVFDLAVLDRIEEGMRRVAHSTAAAHNASVEFGFKRNYPPLVNHAAETAIATDVMTELVGAEAVQPDITPTMAAEDFAYMLQAKPGCYAFIGNGEGEHRLVDHGGGPCLLHNTSYDFNDALIPLGGSYWVRLVERYLAPGTARN